MCWRSASLLILFGGNAVAADDFIIGVGGEGDSGGGIAGTIIADVAVAENTWLSGSLGGTTVDLPRNLSSETWYGDIGIDHWFQPVGVRLGIAYWGDRDVLESSDYRGSLYYRGNKFTLVGDYEYRDFEFTLPATDLFPGRTIMFDANGVGLTTRFELSDNVSLSLSGMDYDYSVNLQLDDNRGILDLLSFSRLSLIASLVDYRAFATLGIDADQYRWQFELGTWKGEVDGSESRAATIRFMAPMGSSSDIELGLGYDDNDLYGGVTTFSVFMYFYGGT